MSFCITSDLTIACNNVGIGGIKRIWVADQDSVDETATVFSPVAPAPPNSMTTITHKTGGRFFEMEFKENTAFYTRDSSLADNFANSGQAIITAVLPKMDETKLAWVRDLLECKCGIYVIFETYATDSSGAGEVFIIGYEQGQRLRGSVQVATGTGRTDQNGYTVSIQGEITSDRAEIIFTPGVAGIPLTPAP